MYYMNTDRDNFHDWARDKPDTTFSALDARRQRPHVDQPAVQWGRLGVLAVLAIALILGFRYLLAGL